MTLKLSSMVGLLILVTSLGCVGSGTHKAVVDELTKTRGELDTTRQSLDSEKSKGKELDDKLTVALDQNQQLVTKVSAMGQNVEQLLGEKDSLSQERARLAAEHTNLAREVDELKRMRAAAEARNTEYRSVLEKLRKMIDAGTLQVKVRAGRMVVQMASDVVFPAGSTRIKPEARGAIVELAQTIKQFPDRKFQVVGHSDATPIRTDRFPSNWELSSQRAIEVVRVMIDSGVPGEMLSAAGNAEFDPIASNDRDEDKSMNRRVEIVFLPKLDELPGFDTVLSGKK